MTPDRIGQFEILAEIAAWSEGGAVYRAKDAKGRMVLLRTLRLDRPGAAERLMRLSLEAKAASVLNSPNIAGVLGGGKAVDVYVVGWEFVEGVKLSITLEKGEALSPAELTDLSRQICSGLDHAHSKGVIHPELKPGNIILEWDGTAKLLDFGMPRKPAAGIEISEALHYVSPEELQGKQPGPRANLFSWGAILYQMVTGQRPFRGETAEALRQKILEETPAPPHEVKSDVHPGLSQIILKTLAKLPAERYGSGAELVRDLENYKRVEIAPPKPSPPPPGPVTAQTASPDLRPKPVPVAAPPLAPTPVAAPTPAAPLASTPAPAPASTTEKETPAASSAVEAPAPAQAAASIAAPKAERPPAAPKPAAAAPASGPPKMLIYGMAGVIVLLLAVIVIGVAVMRKTPATPGSAATPSTPATAPATPVETETGTPALAPGAPALGATPSPSAPSAASGGTAARPAKAKQPPAEPPRPAVVPGQLAIDSTPQGAEVQIDGRRESNWITPYIASLDPGPHTVTVSMAGRMTATRTVEVASGKKTVLAVGLAERAATISVSSDPAEATILLDGQATGKVTPAQLIVAKGAHTITVRKQGYLDASSTLDLAPGQSAQFAPTLKLTGSTQDIKTAGGIGGLFGGAPKDAGRVTVRTNPKGAQVLVNGQPVKKTTPVDFFLNPGNYEITIALAGHKPVKKIITVEKGGKLVLEETLP
ncbi:MAG: PEGA domain-containing protein [Acidobacteria bacterium]|nr:PEGA domain-containing protein [Acidobacteriota bacterium]